ncbi:hypothetical protein B9J90_13435 [Vibrio sp. V09_P4A23P171]|uniref:hypothetical protein n=1 Tax=unclassified Vibrio TaxID=2614977 RepID=UPI000B8E8B40|nr:MULTISPECIES: hypothetical protein [unclassified Vibrio]NCO45017.1 hypothetical protein [Vibrio sp.]NNN98131.1 hypothetical protein [Vibrio sp. B1-2]OXX34142.1 hypothetical protein B9J90_13435 [Vibrio sp. V09_P4A23P171]
MLGLLGGISGGAGGISAGAGPAQSGSSNSQGSMNFGGIGSRNETNTTGLGVAVVIVTLLIIGAFFYATRNRK